MTLPFQVKEGGIEPPIRSLGCSPNLIPIKDKNRRDQLAAVLPLHHSLKNSTRQGIARVFTVAM
jgi:hypothetical protein